MSNAFSGLDLEEKIVAGGLEVLRGKAVMPTIVNKDFSEETEKKGRVINVDISPQAVVTAVTPAMSTPSFSDSTGYTRPIALDYLNKANFHLTTKEVNEINDGLFKYSRLAELIAEMANQINRDVMTVAYQNSPRSVGTAGTVPFASAIDIASDAITALDNAYVPGHSRSFVFGGAAQANFLKLAAVNQFQNAGSNELFTMKKYQPLFGAQPYFDNFVKAHTKGTVTGTLTVGSSGSTPGSNTVFLKTSGSGTLVKGDLIQITTSGVVYGYVVTANASIDTTAAGIPVSVWAGDGTTSGVFTSNSRDNFVPVAHASGDTWTVTASHTANLLLQKDAVCFVTRKEPLDNTLVDVNWTIPDPMTGVLMQVSHYKGYHNEGWELSTLYGIGSIRPGSSVRILG